MRLFATLIFTLLLVTGRGLGQVEFTDEVFSYDAGHPAGGYWVGEVLPESGSRVFAAFLAERDAEKGGEWAVSLTSLMAGAVNSACEKVKEEGSSFGFSFVLGNRELRFEGVMAEDGQRFEGKVLQLKDGVVDEKDISFVFGRALRAAEVDDAMAFTGEISAMGAKMGMTIVLGHTPGGNWVGHLDVPVQGLREYPFVNLREDEEGVLSAMLPVPGGASIEVSLDEGQKKMTGVFKQSGMEMAIDFARDEDYAYREMVRPQHPVPPYPYREREIEVEHPEGFVLAGTLTLPEEEKFGVGPYPVAVMITGSGQQDRDESLMGHKPFLVIADYLARRGIAVMRYDDRAVGGSGGGETLETATTADFATDALAVVNFLKTVKEIDAGHIGLIGHSEGGMIAPLTEQMTDSGVIDFMVFLAGPGVLCKDLLVKQTELGWMAMLGADESVAREHGLMYSDILQMVMDGADEETIVDQMVMLLEKQREAGYVPSLGSAENDRAAMTTQVKALDGAWFHYFLAFDPAPVLRKVRCPVLALNGTKDLQVWHEQNLDAIKRVMKKAGGDITTIRYEGLNHLFQPAVTGAISEYALIETTFDEQVLEDMAGWILKKVAKPEHTRRESKPSVRSGLAD